MKSGPGPRDRGHVTHNSTPKGRLAATCGSPAKRRGVVRKAAISLILGAVIARQCPIRCEIYLSDDPLSRT